jgi:DNA-binding transcriptional ArsR family regulator
LDESRRAPIPDETSALADALKVLASGSRLHLLSALRAPKTLDELILSPSEARAAGSPDRPVSRQAVQRHLDVLLDAGLVRREATRTGGGRSGYAYVLDHTRVFAVVEEIRRLTRYQSTMPADLQRTQQAPEPQAPRWGEGPKLVVVHGVREGHAFALDATALRPPRGWIVGRARSAHVAIAHDPFVSGENAEVLRTPQGFRLLDLPGSKNGTTLNWERLPRGGDAPLRTGDIVGVGRTLLVFRDA